MVSQASKIFTTVLLCSSLFGCAIFENQKNDARNLKRIESLSQNLKKTKTRNQHLKEENRILRQMAGVPERRGNLMVGENLLFSKVKKFYKKRNRSSLRASTRALMRKYPQSPLIDNALYLNAQLDLRQGRMAESLTMFDEIIDKHVSGNQRPKALVGKAKAYAKLNLKSQSRSVLKRLIKEHPKTSEARKARRYLKTNKGL